MPSGNLFEDETRNSLKKIEDAEENFMWLRYPDTRMFQYVNKNIIQPKSPCDFMAFTGGYSYFIECKSSQRTKSYDIRYIKDHQVEALLKHERCGGRSWFLINRRCGRGKIDAWAVKPKLIDTLLKEGCKGVTYNIFESHGVRLERLKGGLWDLNCLFAITK